MAQRSTIELLVAECDGGRGHCRRGPARPGAVVLTQHPRSKPATLGLDFPPGVSLSAAGLERAHELAGLYQTCGWMVKGPSITESHLQFDLRPSRSRSVSLATIVATTTEDLMALVRLQAIAVAEDGRRTP